MLDDFTDSIDLQEIREPEPSTFNKSNFTCFNLLVTMATVAILLFRNTKFIPLQSWDTISNYQQLF